MKIDKNLTAENKLVQKYLNKLIAEEFTANMLYKALATNIKFRKEDKSVVSIFTEIAQDEYQDHYNVLVNYALTNGYIFPVSYSDLEKHSEKCTKQLNSVSKKTDIKACVKLAIQSELDAIESYEDAINQENIPYDLNSILVHNYYDEIEHLNKLQTLMTVVDFDLSLNNLYIK